MATYKISGRSFTFGVLTWAQFKVIAPMLPQLLGAINGANGNPLAVLNEDSVGLMLAAFQELAGPEVNVAELPADPLGLLQALGGVFSDSGLTRAVPPGESPPQA